MLPQEALRDDLDEVSGQQEDSIYEVAFDWLRRIESILRNGLPTDDKAEANTITQAHFEVEKALDDMFPDWWMK